MPRLAAVPEEPEEQRPASFFDDDELAAALEPDDQGEPGQPEQPQPEGRVIDYAPDVQALQAAHGNPNVWAKEFAGLIQAMTGQFIDDTTIAQWLTTYGAQVQTRTHRDAMFQVANTQLPAHLVGDPALTLLHFRDEIAQGFRHQAGF